MIGTSRFRPEGWFGCVGTRGVPLKRRWLSQRTRHRRMRAARGALVALLVAVLAGLPTPASAVPTILYVQGNHPSCSDSGAGTSTQPFCTIIKGGNVAVAAQTVEVRAGTYTGEVDVANSGTSSQPIVFRPAAGAFVTVTGGQSGFNITGNSWVTVQGFNVTNTTSHGFNVETSSNIILRNNTASFAGEPVSGQIARGINLKSSTNCLIEANTVHHNTDHGIYVASSATSNTIRTNVSYENARGYARAAAGISTSNAGNNTYVSNIAHDNEDTGIQMRGGAYDNLVVNNVSYNNGDHGIDTLGATGTR